MEIRDPVHGSIHILEEEENIIKDDFFQRLRNIKQLGFSEYVFPGATHSRFIHSIGVMSVGERAFNKLFKNQIQLILPTKRLHFEKNGKMMPNSWFDTCFICYKMDLPNDINYME